MKKVENKTKTIKVKSKFSLYLQLVLTVIAIILLVLAFINDIFYLPLQFVLGIDLITVGINNKKVYKKKFSTVFYVVVGLVIILYALLSALGIYL